MSNSINELFVQQYGTNIQHLSQQKGSRLKPFVRTEMVKGKAAFFDRLGAVTAVIKSGRHSDTPLIETPHSRRMCTLASYEIADLIDNADLVRTLIDPTNQYVVAQANALGRSMDDVLIAAMSGTAYTGESGTGTQSLGTDQKLASVSAGAFANLNVSALRKAKEFFDGNDVDESIPRYIALTSSQLNSLLGQTEVTSSDYNVVKALVMGQVDTFLGFKFIRTERLVTQTDATAFNLTTGLYDAGGSSASGKRKVLAWAQDGVVLGVGQDIKAKISERDDKSYSMQAYASMDIGAVRMEEAKVVEILCAE